MKEKKNKSYLFKIADSEAEFESIHKLNYRTFAVEIPQHDRNEEGILIDKFHDENTYFIALDGEILAGMVAVRGNRPFSLDAKVPDLDSYLEAGKHVCEIRLLAVEPEYRRGPVFFGIMKKLNQYCRNNGYDYAVASGTTRQLKLYEHMGFKPFYHLVGKEGAYYQPLYVTADLFDSSLNQILDKIAAE